MNDNTLKNSGRKPADRELSYLGQEARRRLRLPSENGEYDNLKAREANHEPIRGCSVLPGDAERGLWAVKFYISGAQRMVARLPLNEAARLYDALLFHFEKYRTNAITPEREKLWFNFSREHAKQDLEENENLREVVFAFEKILNDRGLLVLRTDRHEQSRVNRAEKAKRYTFKYQFNEGIEELRTHIFELVGELEKVNAELKAVNRKLDRNQRDVDNSKPACHIHGTPFETAPVDPNPTITFS